VSETNVCANNYGMKMLCEYVCEMSLQFYRDAMDLYLVVIPSMDIYYFAISE